MGPVDKAAESWSDHIKGHVLKASWGLLKTLPGQFETETQQEAIPI